MALFGTSDQKRLFDMHREPQEFGLDLFRKRRLNFIRGLFDFQPDDGQWCSKFMRHLRRVALQLVKRQADPGEQAVDMLLEFPKLTFVRFDSDLNLEIIWIDGVQLIVQGNNWSKRFSNNEPPVTANAAAIVALYKARRFAESTIFGAASTAPGGRYLGVPRLAPRPVKRLRDWMK